MNNQSKSIFNGKSNSKVDTFEEKEFSKIKNSKRYCDKFLRLIQQEDEAQISRSQAKKTMTAEFLATLAEELFLIRLEKELGKMEAAESILQIRIGKNLYPITYEQEKSTLLLPDISKYIKIREEKLLLVSKIPKAIIAIFKKYPLFTLVADDSNEYLVDRSAKSVKRAISYVMDQMVGKSAKIKEQEGIGSGFKAPNYDLESDYDTKEQKFGDQHLYSRLLKDHEIVAYEEDCFSIVKANAFESHKNSNIKIELKRPQITKKTFELDSNQLEAISIALNSSISLIIGPPGTGKTHTAVILAMILDNQILKALNKDNKKLLICAQSNTGVNNLASKLAEYGVNITKITSRKLMENEKDLKTYDLSKKLKKKVQNEISLKNLSCNQLIEKLKTSLFKVRTGERLSFEEKRLLYYHEEILSESQVICCTLAMITSKLINRIGFPFIIMDEASQATEPEALIAFNKHPQKLIMFGDDKQLCPTVISQRAKQQGLSYSLFARLVSNRLTDIKVHMLTTQYRMPSRLAEFSSHEFYDSKLKSHKANPSKEFKWMFEEFATPDKKTPIALFDVKTAEKLKNGAIKNEGEAQKLVATIKKLINRRVLPHQIGIIAYYALQVDYIKDLLFQEGISGVEVNSIDGFQGRDKEIIMISTVRSNEKGIVGFSDDPQRFNVAVTRAKEWIFLFCNKETMRKVKISDSSFANYNFLSKRLQSGEHI